jgi:hypothetical protein
VMLRITSPTIILIAPELIYAKEYSNAPNKNKKLNYL